MCSQLKPFSLMGMPNNSEVLKFNFLVRPALEFEEDQDQDQEQDQEQEQEIQEEQKEGEKCKLMVSCLKIKLPSSLDQESKINNNQEQEQEQELDLDDDDGLKTPTSLEKRIPLVLSCPPAPRKPRPLPCNKRKLMGGRRRVLLDLSNEIESLFPNFGAKIKKVRPEII